MPTRTPMTLPDISSRAWEHPADRGALNALRQLRGFVSLLRDLGGGAVGSVRDWATSFVSGRNRPG